MDLETLVVSFGADLSNLTRGVAGAKLLLAGFGLAALGVGVASVKMASDFQAGMLTIKTGAGGVHENIAALSQSVLGLSDATGTGTKGLIDGLFMIESSGQRSSQAINTLTMAAEGAKVGHAELGVVAKGTTTIMTDFASSNVTAAQAVNALVATVGDGQTNMQDLSASLSSILPVASSLKVHLNDVMGAMATMTAQGVPAADAATYLRQMMMSLAAPSKAASTSLTEIGLSAQQVSDEMKVSLPDTLAMIEDHLKKKFPEGSMAYTDALKNIAGGSKQMQGMLDLTGSHLSVFGQDVTDIAGKVKAGGNSILGWSDVQGTFNFKLDQAKSAVETLMIKIGTALLPSLSNLFDKITPLISQFGDWITKSGVLKDITNGLATVVGGIPGTIDNVTSAIQNIAHWYQQWHDLINNVVVILTAFFIPAIIKSGVESVIAGAKTTGSFVASIVKAGYEGWAAAGKIAAFIGSLVATGARAAATGAIMAGQFIWGLIQTGLQAAKSAAIVTGQFIVMLVQMATQTAITAAGFIADLIPAVVSMTAAFITAAAAAIPGMIAGLISATVATWSFTAALLANPITWVVLAIVALIAILVLLVTHWQQVAAFAQMIWGHIVAFFKDDVATPIGNLFNAIGTKIHDVLTNMGNAFNNLRSLVSNVWSAMVGDVKGAINWIIGGIDNFIRGIDSIHVNVPGVGNVGFNIPTIPLLAAGGSVAPGGVAIAGEAGPELVFGGSGGARVLSNSQSMGMLGGGNGKVTLSIPLIVNGKQIAMAMIDDLGEAMASGMRSSGHPVGSF